MTKKYPNYEDLLKENWIFSCKALKNIWAFSIYDKSGHFIRTLGIP